MPLRRDDSDATPRPKKAATRAPRAYRNATYIYARTSSLTGNVTWWGDFRRFAAVGGRLERLSAHVADGEDAIADEQHALMVYWKVARDYQKRLDGEGDAGNAKLGRPEPPTNGGAGGPARSRLAGERGVAGVHATPVRLASENPPAPQIPQEVADILERLERKLDAAGPPVPIGGELTLATAIAIHMRQKRELATQGNGRISTCETDETSLKSVVRHLGADRRLKDITPAVLVRYIADRLKEDGWRAGTTISNATVRNELHALSNLFTEFARRGDYEGDNPVSKVTKPAAPDKEAEYLQLSEGARLLDAAVAIDLETKHAKQAMELVRKADHEAARGRPRSTLEKQWLNQAERLYPTTVRGEGWHRRFEYVEALIATFLYTGGRSAEVRGLCVEEIDWERSEINFRDNKWRKLKGKNSKRKVPVSRELLDLLRRYLANSGITEGLLFVGSEGGMVGGLQTIFPRCVLLAKIARRITPHALRHTFATGMLNTYTISATGLFVQRSAFQVAKLLGHGDSDLVDDTYGHLIWHAGLMTEFAFNEHRQAPQT